MAHPVVPSQLQGVSAAIRCRRRRGFPTRCFSSAPAAAPAARGQPGTNSAIAARPGRHRSLYAERRLAVKASAAVAAAKAEEPSDDGNVTLKVAAITLFVIAMGIANRLLYKMALVPMGNYGFFLSQLQCFGYVLVYCGILYTRYRSGIVSPEMLKRPKLPFAAIGFLEAVTTLTQISLAVRLPGALLPLLAQSIVMWQLLLSAVVLGRRYTLWQVLGAMVVICGVVLAGIPPSQGLSAASMEAVRTPDVILFSSSMSLIAISSLIKEKVFRDAKKDLGKDLDLFVVNSTGSTFQALFVFLLLPVLTKLKGLSMEQLPGYMYEGFQCFLGQVPRSGVDPTGAPLVPCLYVIFNLAFNISALYLLRVAGSVVASLAISSILPMTVLAFSFPLPLLGNPAPLGPYFGAGFVVLLLGMWAFNAAPKAKQSS